MFVEINLRLSLFSRIDVGFEFLIAIVGKQAKHFLCLPFNWLKERLFYEIVS